MRNIATATTSSRTSSVPLVPRITSGLGQGYNASIARGTAAFSGIPSVSSTSPYVEHGPSQPTTDRAYSEVTDDSFTTGTSMGFLQQSFPEMQLDRQRMAESSSDLQQESAPDREDIILPPHKVCSFPPVVVLIYSSY